MLRGNPIQKWYNLDFVLQQCYGCTICYYKECAMSKKRMVIIFVARIQLSGTVFLLLTHNNDKFEFYSQHFYKLSYNITNVEEFFY